MRKGVSMKTLPSSVCAVFQAALWIVLASRLFGFPIENRKENSRRSKICQTDRPLGPVGM